MNDPLRGLADLRSAEPTAARADRTRRRCRAELTRRAERAVRAAAPSRRRAGAPLWQLALAGLCVAYVAEAVALTLGFLQSR